MLKTALNCIMDTKYKLRLFIIRILCCVVSYRLILFSGKTCKISQNNFNVFFKEKLLSKTNQKSI
jgi:hypothetical protein